PLHDPGRCGSRLHRHLFAQRLPAAGRRGDAAPAGHDAARYRLRRPAPDRGPDAQPGLRAAAAGTAPTGEPQGPRTAEGEEETTDLTSERWLTPVATAPYTSGRFPGV